MAVTPFASKYNSVSLPEMESKTEKEKQSASYNRQIVEWLYSMYVRERTEITAEFVDVIDELRAYAAGKQNTDKYKTYFASVSASSTGDTDNTMTAKDYHKKGWLNLDVGDVVSFIPTLLSAIEGTISDNDYEIKADPIDYDSGYEEDKLMHQTYVKNKFAPLLAAMAQQAGIPMEEAPVLSTDFEELEQFKKDGLFKEPYIRSHEQLLSHTEAFSKWDNNIHPKAKRDLLTFGYAFSHVKYDDATHKVKWEYIDPKNVIMQYSNEEDFSDVDFGGYLKWTTLTELRAKSHMMSDGEKTGITEEEIYELAKDYKGMFGNPELPSSFSDAKRQNIDYGSYKVLELHGYWRDVDNKKEIVYTKKNGKTRIYDMPEEGIEKLGDREQVRNIRRRRLYRCSWLVGSKWVYNYGLYPNQGIVGKDPIFPVQGVKLIGDTKAIVHRLKMVADVFHISWVRLMNGIGKATEGGYAVDVTRLMMNDPKKFNPLNVIKGFIEGNFFFYKTTGINGMGVAGNPVPIQYVPGNIRELVEPYMQWLQWCVQFAENLTGIPLLMIGATPKTDTAVGVSEMSLQSAQASLRPVLDCSKKLKEQLAEVSSTMVQCIIKYDDIGKAEYEKVIGKANISVIADSTLLPIQMGITLRARPSMAERQTLSQMVDLALENGRNGQPGLTPDQAMYVKEQIFAGCNISEIRSVLKKMVEKDRQRLHKEKMEAIDRQGQINQQTVQLQNQTAKQIEQMKQQGMAVEYDLKTRSQMLIDNNKSKNTIDEIIAKVMAQSGADVSMLQAENSIQGGEAQPQMS
jgi:hypothetical protein